VLNITVRTASRHGSSVVTICGLAMDSAPIPRFAGYEATRVMRQIALLGGLQIDGPSTSLLLHDERK